MTAVSLSPVFNNDHSVSDANGAPRSGAHLHTYLAGTSTPASTFKESTGTTGHANPIILDANGLPPAPIWLQTGFDYKFVLAPSTDTTPPVSAILTIDNITGINDVNDVVSTEWTPSAMTPTYISATSFSVTGDQTTTLHVGRRLKLTESGGLLYGTIIKSTFTSLTTVTVLLDSGSLTSDFTGNDWWYGIISAASTSVPFLSRDQQCGRLIYVSATQIRLDPQDGNTIWVYTAAAGWARRTIPSAGVTAANTSIYINGTSGQNLVLSTGYYVYLFDLAGVLTMDFSTTAPAVDATTGLYIKTGDSTRLLIGIVKTNASAQFQVNGRGVLSWYRRRAIQVTGAAFTGAATTASVSYVELEVAAAVNFLSWGEEAIQAQFMGSASNSTAAQTHITCLVLDGATVALGGTQLGVDSAVHTVTANYRDNVSCGGMATVTAVSHSCTVNGKVGANTGTWHAGTLYVMTQG